MRKVHKEDSYTCLVNKLHFWHRISPQGYYLLTPAQQIPHVQTTVMWSVMIHIPFTFFTTSSVRPTARVKVMQPHRNESGRGIVFGMRLRNSSFVPFQR